MERHVSETKEKIKPKEFFETSLFIFKLYFKLSPWRAILLFITNILVNLQQIFYAYIFAKIIDTVIKLAQQGSTNFSSLAPYIVVLLAYSILFDFIGLAQGYARRFFRMTSRNKLDVVLYTHLHSLGIETLENPGMNDLIERSRDWLYDTLDVFLESISTISQIIRLIVSAAIIATFAPALVPAIFTVTIIKFLPDRYFSKKDFHWQVDQMQERRKASAPISDLSNPRTLQEITIVGAFDYLNKKVTDFYGWYYSGFLKLLKQRQFANAATSVLEDIANIGSYAVVFFRLMIGKVSVGLATFQIRAVDSFFSSASNALDSMSMINDFVIKMEDLIKLFKLKPTITNGTIRLRELTTPPSIEFKDITFAYPNAERHIFDHFNLTIRAGEKIALVGANGAGKTTLIKLLARFYAPEQGSIEINGIDLRELEINEWYKNFGILFQDFNTYGYLTAEENIHMGRPMKERIMETIMQAAQHADAHEFIQEFKNGYDEFLSERYKNGTRPSTGQWQKIAIARFFYRNPPVVIFDEPTASIDAVSEYKIFNKIYEFFANKTVIIVSHRFSTVRNADRIIVLDKGKIIEQGTHQELLDLGGHYTHAFKLQAEGYR